MQLLLTLLFTAILFAQQPAPEAAKPRRPMPEPKNLQVLKVPTPELVTIMRGYNASLGVQCTFCHVQGDFASDEKRHKLIARQMITMNQDINNSLAKLDTGHGSADTKVSVSCFTCHRGEEHPKVTPPAAAASGPGTPGAAGPGSGPADRPATPPASPPPPPQ